MNIVHTSVSTTPSPKIGLVMLLPLLPLLVQCQRRNANKNLRPDLSYSKNEMKKQIMMLHKKKRLHLGKRKKYVLYPSSVMQCGRNAVETRVTFKKQQR